MQIWTTFSPQKVCWELTTIQNKGRGGTSDWMMQQKLIEESLILLKKSGVSGIRLVIFPNELTKDGKTFNWISLDSMLTICQRHGLLVDLCLGPYQYPYYPGIYMPERVLPLHKRLAEQLNVAIDSFANVRQYGLRFLEKQLTRYGKDNRIRGFHFANEWPDKQHIAGREEIKAMVTKDFMLEAATLIKKMTKKPICMNTNIDASSRTKVFNTFKDIFVIFDKQGMLGFDIYPSQETWRKAPLQKINRIFDSYTHSYTKICTMFFPCEIYFAEVEAQPWGDGRSWYNIILAEQSPQEKVLLYTRESLQTTWENHIAETPCQTISLWGADFWLSAHMMGLHWPLEKVKNLKLISSFS